MLKLEFRSLFSTFAQDGGTLRTSLFLQDFCLEQNLSENKSLRLSWAASVLEPNLRITES